MLDDDSGKGLRDFSSEADMDEFIYTRLQSRSRAEEGLGESQIVRERKNAAGFSVSRTYSVPHHGSRCHGSPCEDKPHQDGHPQH